MNKPDGKDLDNPMMLTREIEAIDKIIAETKPQICLEFGAGGSTVYFPKKHDCIKQWLSIEENGRYAKALGEKVDKEKVALIWASDQSAWFSDSVKYQPKRYGLILVDGLQRGACLRAGRELLKDGGVMLLHDFDRDMYKEDLKEFKVHPLCEKDKSGSRGLAIIK